MVDTFPLWVSLVITWVLILVYLQKTLYRGSKIANHGFEFGGPIGAAGLVFVLPATVYALYFTCNEYGCMSVNPLSSDFLVIADPITSQPLDELLKRSFSLVAVQAVLGWYCLHLALYGLMPGPKAQGLPVQGTGERLTYQLNGFRCGIASVVIVIGAVYQGYISASFGYDHYLELITASTLASTALAVYSYLVSFYEKQVLAAGGNTGNVLYDFFIGRPLNPRFSFIDIKFFCELRPGLVLWFLLDLSMAAAQLEHTGTVTNSMMLVVFFHGWYVADALYNEKAILSTMDIVTDGFGYMLAFGDLAWLPFVYSAQSRYLVTTPVDLSIVMFLTILGINLIGFYIFRAANSQKNLFRTNPNHPAVANLKTLQTKRGTRLIVSSWWGRSRHINYFGDFLMGLSYCLPCGFDHAIPYFYALYFTILLVHRQQRDDHICRGKYGKDWDRYCELVPYNIIPYVY